MSTSDYSVVKLAVLAEVKATFRPEFVNRIDEIVVFHALDENNIKAIAKIQLGYLERRVAAMDMRLEVSDAALADIASTGFDTVYGARPLKRAIQSRIENPLAKEILNGRFGPGDIISVTLSKGEIVFSKKEAVAA
jgi:ATP-dependent Clp protease ATP-binding subunit ClpB